MALIIKDRVKEVTTTTGTGTITLAGASTGFRSFADIGNANTTYYTIAGQGTNEWEVGLGTYTASGTTLSRDTVLSNSLGTTANIDFSAGTKDVFCTYPSEKALLGSTSSVSSTGTGNVVLNSNPTFATDITVNGLTVGKGSSNVATNTAFGFDALGSPYASASNVNNVGIGYNALNNIGAGVNTFTNRVGGSGYVDGDGQDTFTQAYFLTYLSGTPLISGGQFPYVDIQVTSGVVTSVVFNNNEVNNRGYGFVDTTTVMTAVIDGGTGFSIKVGTLLYSNNNVAIGYNTGLAVSENAISIGYNAKASNNTVELGNSSITQTNFYGNLNNINGDINFSGSNFGDIKFGYAMLGGKIDIGGLFSSGDINIGLSETTQTVNISTGAIGLGDFKYINIGNGTGGGGREITLGSTTGVSNTTVNGTLTSPAVLQLTGSATVNQNIATSQTSGSLTIGGTGATGTITLGRSTGNQAVNIATGNTASGSTKTVNIGTGGLAGSTSNIAIGSTTGTSTTTLNGAVTLSATTQALNLGTNQTSGAINIGGSGSATGAITIGQSTGTQRISIGSDTVNTVSSGATRTINIGTTASDTGVSNVTIGRASPTVNHTTTVRGRYVTINASTTLSLVTGGALVIGQNLAQTTTSAESLGDLTEVVTGSRAFVTDALAPVFGSVVVGGGAVAVPVYYDGTDWRVG